MNTDQLYIILYFIVWVITFIVYIRRKRTFDAGACLLLAYVIYSFFSYFAYKTNYFNNFEEPKLFPYIYLFISVIIVMYPVLKTNTGKNTQLAYPNIKLFKLYCILIILFSLVQLPDIISQFKMGLIRILSDNGGADLYHETIDLVEQTGSGISNIFAILSGAVSGMAILVFFYSLTMTECSRRLRIALIIPCFIGILYGIATGQRGAMIQPLLIMLVTYFALYKHIPNKINRILRAFAIVVVVLISIPFIAMTISRFDTANNNVNDSLYFYAGQSSLYFNNNALNDNGIRYGDRTIPLFKRIVGFSDVPKNFVERREKYPHLKMNDEVFCTFVGDIAIDFGPVLGFIIIVVCSTAIFFKTRPNRNILYFHQLIVLHFVMYLCIIGGLKLYPFSDVGGNLKLIVYILSYILFKNFSLSYERH